ncbi:molybdenum cofactor guanylyltransferase [Luedemannella flava]|uniref:Molybdenum cofactor guanylyltransferase n=2 Tax=Luedemannella flava TaxID=349316 RepID=A0ABP4YPF8_9ACTN
MARPGPKPALAVGGVPMVLRVLGAVEAARPRVVVGPDTLAGLLPPDVIVTMESPPAGGPAAAAAAGLAVRLPDHGPRPDIVVLLAADLPFLTADAVDTLVAAARDGGRPVDGAVAVDGDGREQWLCGAWSVAALRARISQVGELSGTSLRALLGGLTATHVRLADVAQPTPTFDCDTVDDLNRAEEMTHGRA